MLYFTPVWGLHKIRDRSSDIATLFSYVPQKPFILNGTFRENIEVFLQNEVTTDALNSVVNDFGLSELLMSDSSISANDLSGGERQKLSLIRAILRKSPVLLLDEPDNNLDIASKTLLENFIVSTSATVIYVTHNKPISVKHKILQL